MNNIDLLHDQENRVRKFMNRMQLDAMMVSAHNEYIVAARGTGKSEGLDARFILRNVWAMPGSMGVLYLQPTPRHGETHCPQLDTLLQNGDILKIFTITLVRELLLLQGLSCLNDHHLEMRGLIVFIFGTVPS